MTDDNLAQSADGACCPRCGQPFTPRRGGKRQRFCSSGCRKLAWREACRLASAQIGGAPRAQTNVQSNANVATAPSGAKDGHAVGNACRWCGAALARSQLTFCPGTDCGTRFTTALRRWALLEFEAGRLTAAQLRQTDKEWLDSVAEAREARLELERQREQGLARRRRRLRARRQRRLRMLKAQRELPS